MRPGGFRFVGQDPQWQRICRKRVLVELDHEHSGGGRFERGFDEGCPAGFHHLLALRWIMRPQHHPLKIGQSESSAVRTYHLGGNFENWHGSSFPQRYYFTTDGRRFAKPRPGVRELAALIEQITAAVCALDLVGDRMREGHLGYLSRKRRSLGAPIPEAAAKAVRRQIGMAHAPHQHQQRHVAERPARALPWKYEIARPDRGHSLDNRQRG